MIAGVLGMLFIIGGVWEKSLWTILWGVILLLCGSEMEYDIVVTDTNIYEVQNITYNQLLDDYAIMLFDKQSNETLERYISRNSIFISRKAVTNTSFLIVSDYDIDFSNSRYLVGFKKPDRCKYNLVLTKEMFNRFNI